jgi:hypothetical protein
MQHFKLDIRDIRQNALNWKTGHKCSLHEFLDYVVRLAQDSGYTVASTHLNDDFMEVRLSTAEVVQFSRPELR